MKKLLWVLLFLFLCGTALVLATVSAIPEEARLFVRGAMVGRLLVPGLKEQPLKKFVVVAEPTPTPGPGKLTSPTAPGGAAKPSGPPPRRPPKKTAGTLAELPTKHARYLGPGSDPVITSPPPPELYPLRVDKRTRPSPGMVQLELSVRNLSGKAFRLAQVVLKSPGYPEPQVFEVEDWQVDEVIGLEYPFPSDQVEARVSKLRIVRVSGEVMESALSSSLSERRSLLVESAIPMDQAALEAASAQTTETTLGMVKRAAGLRVHLADARLSETLPLFARAKSPAAVKAGELAKEALVHGHAMEAALKDLAAKLGSEGYEKGMAGGGTALLAKVREERDAFNGLALRAMLLLDEENAPGNADLKAQFEQMAATVLAELEAVERQVQATDQGFTFDDQTPAP